MKHRVHYWSAVALSISLFASSLAAQNNPPEVIRGPFYSATIRGPGKNEVIAMKGLVVTVGKDRNAYLCYDTDLLRLSMAWTGQFLEFGNTQSQITWPPPPQVKGSSVFSTQPAPGWAKAGSFADPRPNGQGPLPKDWAHYEGLYQSGDNVVLKYTVGKTELLELPGCESINGQPVFTRTIQAPKGAKDLMLLVLSAGSATTTKQPNGVKLQDAAAKRTQWLTVEGATGAEWVISEGQVVLKLAKLEANHPVRVVIRSEGDAADSVKLPAMVADLRELTKGGPAHWLETVTTKGTLGGDAQPYVADTITEPVNNPYHAKTFFGGFDFFSDGRAAICTFHGDVWIVSGIDATLEKLTWKRFATGLFQPLGLKIVKDEVYVLGRDQITRLHDLNGDGEADYFENFNNDTVVTSNYHEFTLDLHTDPQGNFYFAKGAPWEPEVTSPHQGCLFKLSKDGSKLEVIATGFRAPNGMTVGPKGEITVSDNQGHWMPSSKLNWIEKGGFYGMTPSAHRLMNLNRGGSNFVANPSQPEERKKYGFKGWDAGSPLPDGYDKPLCWLPMTMDNSSGGQVWATSTKWGPLDGKLLFMSYGKCTLFEVMIDEVGGTRQAAMYQLPLKFNSGLMRARVNPKDGQVYVAGLKGWQTSATRDGGFYRVRYTGKSAPLPASFRATEQGIELTFTTAVEAKSAADPGNYTVEEWNYRWTGAYGSAEISVKDPNVNKHDACEVKSAKLLPDGRTVLLEVADFKPADQIKLKYRIDGIDGAPVSQEIYGTAYKLAPAKAH